MKSDTKYRGHHATGLWTAATLFVVFIYIVVPLVMLMRLFDFTSSGGETYVLVFFGVPYLLLLALAAIGVGGMRFALRKMREVIVVKSWSLMAAGLAPVSSWLNAYLMGRVLWPMLFGGRPAFASDFAFTLLCYGSGFYLPFIFLTLWLKYHYRQDEF